MTKTQKIEYINDIYQKFYNASNHGNNDNWWYPTANTIAYNVKLYGSSKNIDDVREALSDRQKEYYSDDPLQNEMVYIQNYSCEMLIMDIKAEYGLDSHFAGRSGGWIEVEYNNEIDYMIDENSSSEDIKENYKIAKELNKLECKVKQFIEDRLSGYQKYINSDEYINDIIINLLSDEDIANEYRNKIHLLTNKLN